MDPKDKDEIRRRAMRHFDKAETYEEMRARKKGAAARRLGNKGKKGKRRPPRPDPRDWHAGADEDDFEGRSAWAGGTQRMRCRANDSDGGV